MEYYNNIVRSIRIIEALTGKYNTNYVNIYLGT